MTARPSQPIPVPTAAADAAVRVIAYPSAGPAGRDGRDGEPGPAGPRGPEGPPGPRYPGPILWTGQGTPPEVVVGAKAGDRWLDELTGDIYELR